MKSGDKEDKWTPDLFKVMSLLVILIWERKELLILKWTLKDLVGMF